MGVGKTTIGRRLAAALARPFHDTDEHLEAATSRSVEDFFVHGEEATFRALEAGAVADLLALGPVVLALGGGALINDGSRTLLGQQALLVHLEMRWEDLRERIPALIATRPLLRGRSLEDIHTLYLARLPTYRSAEVTVVLEPGNPAGAVEQVLAALRRP